MFNENYAKQNILLNKLDIVRNTAYIIFVAEHA